MGKIGLQRLLFQSEVPGGVSPARQCGRGDQTVAHLFTECADARSKGLRVFGYATEKDVHQGLSHHDTARDTACAVTQSGWLPQFRVFNGLQQAGLATESNNHAWARRPPTLINTAPDTGSGHVTWLALTRPGVFCPSPFPPPFFYFFLLVFLLVCLSFLFFLSSLLPFLLSLLLFS